LPALAIPPTIGELVLRMMPPATAVNILTIISRVIARDLRVVIPTFFGVLRYLFFEPL
jgi:hypothetical protein